MAESPSKTPIEEDQKPKTPAAATTTTSVFGVWAYVVLFVSLLTFLLSSLPSLHSPSPTSWFLSLPDDLRHHYSIGKLIKLPPTPTHLFVSDHRPSPASETLLLLPGLGSSSFSFRHLLPSLASLGLRSLALDLPGSGFSDPPPKTPSWYQSIYRDIKQNGIFWAFDHLIETGHIPQHHHRTPDAADVHFSRAIAQVVDSLGLAPVHLVAHDSGLLAAANWVSMNPDRVRSVTIIDSSAQSAAFPAWLLGFPGLGDVLVRSRFLFAGLVRLCCSRTMDGAAAEAYRVLLRRREGRRGVVEAGRGLNHSFDLGEWAASEGVRDLPVQILWSHNWSDLWIDEGKRLAAAVPRAKFGAHFGGRWPQEDAAGEIADMIAQFVLSLPRSARRTDEEALPEHIEKMFVEANNAKHDDQDDHRHHGYEHEASYMNMYGMGQE